MKTLLSALFLLTVKSIFGECGNSGISFWPANGNLMQGQAIIIEGFYQTEDFIKAIGTTYKVYLQADDKKVKMLVKEMISNDRGESQVILFPEEPLIIGKDYQLVYDPENTEVIFGFYNRTKKKMESVHWTITEPIKIPAFNWSSTPEKIEVIYWEMGCGPELHLGYKLNLKDLSEMLIKVHVTDKKSKKTSFYIVPASDDQIYFGRSMCGGQFDLTYGNEYEVKFELLDLFSLQTIAISKQVAFKAVE